MRRMLAALASMALIGCSGGPAESGTERAASAAPDAFVGTWKSVTPSLEFIRLTVVSKSSQQGVMGARLTFSGVAWEGSGRVDGDSLRLDMNVAGSTTPSGILVVSAPDAQTLRVQARPASAPAIDLTLIREP